jgi:hypothetical protein
MTETEKELFGEGYNECKRLFLHELRKIAELPTGHKAAVREYVANLEKEMAEEHWASIQKEFPGITREQYEAELEPSIKVIRETYYSENGYLKPRLVKNQ